MSNKKLLIAFFSILIIVIIVFIVALKGLRGDTIIPSKKDNKTTIEYEKKVEKVESGAITGKYPTSVKNSYYYSLTQEERDYIDSTIDSIVEMINTKDINSIYKRFSTEYINARFHNTTILKEYLDETLKDDKYLIKSFWLIDDTLYIDVYLQSNKKSTNTIMVTNYKNSESEENNLYFGVYYGTDHVRGLYRSKLIDIETDNMIYYTDKISYVLCITNHSKEEITIDLKDSKLVENYDNYEKRYNLVTNNIITIPANSSKYVEVGFKEANIDPSYIDFKAEINGEEFNLNYYIARDDIL